MTDRSGDGEPTMVDRPTSEQDGTPGRGAMGGAGAVTGGGASDGGASGGAGAASGAGTGAAAAAGRLGGDGLANDRAGGPGGASTEGFEACYQREWAGLVALGWSLTGSWTAAEELAQDAFADAYRRWDHVGALDRPGAWIRRAVVNRAASHHRHRSVEERGRRRLRGRAAVDADRSSSDRTGELATAGVDDVAFWDAVRSLPDRQAAAIALHYLEDRSVAEIAEVLDCAAATVKVHLHRGRRRLADLLAPIAEEA